MYGNVINKKTKNRFVIGWTDKWLITEGGLKHKSHLEWDNDICGIFVFCTSFHFLWQHFFGCVGLYTQAYRHTHTNTQMNTSLHIYTHFFNLHKIDQIESYGKVKMGGGGV